MLVKTNFDQPSYVIALNEASSFAELAADFSYLKDAPPGLLTFDFTHMASNPLKIASSPYLAGNFGFHPLDHLIEQLSFIGRLVQMPLFALNVHTILVILPTPSSQLGRFFTQLGLFDLITQWRLPIESRKIWEERMEGDDSTRVILVPLTDIGIKIACVPNSTHIAVIKNELITQLSKVFNQSFDTVMQLSSTLGEIIEGTIKLVRGGLIAASYFPETGYLELSIMNRSEGALGMVPDEQLDALVNYLETESLTFQRVNDQVKRCYGTLRLSNGHASVVTGPDESFITLIERTDIPTSNIPGARATIILQLPPRSVLMWEDFARERVVTMWSTILN
ncbi:MAG: hypothetical protein KJ077_25710 [Anaerolineae bacterium]|nr:hypothetical protein [Anaerolineae bacterium]